MGTDDQDPTERMAAAEAAPADGTEDADSDVSGHLHPALTEHVGRVRQHDFLAEAERDRRGAQARPHERDGGMLDKIRRRIER